MLAIVVDAIAIDIKLDAMSKELVLFEFHMREEMTAWQTEDMRRRYPNTTMRDNVVQTSVWPTTRLAAKKKKKRSVVRRVVGGGGVKRPKSARPILRPQLVDKLNERMTKLMVERLSWQ
jgi:hypothetical protein